MSNYRLLSVHRTGELDKGKGRGRISNTLQIRVLACRKQETFITVTNGAQGILLTIMRQRSACTRYFYQPAMIVMRWTDDWPRETKNLGPHVLHETEVPPLQKKLR